MRREEQRAALDKGQLGVQPGRRRPDRRQEWLGDKVCCLIPLPKPAELIRQSSPQHQQSGGCEEGEHRGGDGAEGPGDG